MSDISYPDTPITAAVSEPFRSLLAAALLAADGLIEVTEREIAAVADQKIRVVRYDNAATGSITWTLEYNP